MWERKVIKGKLEIPDPKENRQEVIFNLLLSLYINRMQPSLTVTLLPLSRGYKDQKETKDLQ